MMRVPRRFLQEQMFSECNSDQFYLHLLCVSDISNILCSFLILTSFFLVIYFLVTRLDLLV